MTVPLVDNTLNGPFFEDSELYLGDFEEFDSFNVGIVILLKQIVGYVLTRSLAAGSLSPTNQHGQPRLHSHESEWQSVAGWVLTGGSTANISIHRFGTFSGFWHENGTLNQLLLPSHHIPKTSVLSNRTA